MRTFQQHNIFIHDGTAPAFNTNTSMKLKINELHEWWCRCDTDCSLKYLRKLHQRTRCFCSKQMCKLNQIQQLPLSARLEPLCVECKGKLELYLTLTSGSVSSDCKSYTMCTGEKGFRIK